MADAQAVEPGGSPGTATSSVRSRTQPASNQPQPEQRRGHGAQAADDAREHHETLETARARPKPGPKPPLQPARCRSGAGLAAWPLDGELSLVTGFIETTPPELQLGVLEPGRDADQLREVHDRHRLQRSWPSFVR